MSPRLEQWLVGLANAAISGTAAAVGSLAAGVTFKQGAVVVMLSTGVSLLKWLVQHPIPGENDPQ